MYSTFDILNNILYKLKTNTMNKIQKDLLLLPFFVKKIALTILSASILLMALSISKIIIFDKELIKTITDCGFLISFLLLAVTKNKIEDELTLRIRLKAFAATFIYGVVKVILELLISLVSDGSLSSGDGASQLLIGMFIFYFIMMFIMKRNM